MLDKYGRKINYLRVSITDRCNLSCIYCREEKENISTQCHSKLGTNEIIKTIKAGAALGINSIRFTGGEPLLFKNIDKLIYKTSNIYGIEDISITTNGILLGDMAYELKKYGVNRINISIDSLDKHKYKYITRGGDLNKVIGAVEKCIDLAMEPVKINMVIMKGINDGEIKEFINLTKELPVHVRFIELMPIGERVKLFESSFMSAEEVFKNFPKLLPVESDKFSAVKLYKLNNGKGKVGFIKPLSCKLCKNCNRIRLTCEGIVKPCLHSGQQIDISSSLNNEILLNYVLKKIIYNKPAPHHLEEDNISEIKKMMFQIGG